MKFLTVRRIVARTTDGMRMKIEHEQREEFNAPSLSTAKSKAMLLMKADSEMENLRPDRVITTPPRWGKWSEEHKEAISTDWLWLFAPIPLSLRKWSDARKKEGMSFYVCQSDAVSEEKDDGPGITRIAYLYVAIIE